MATQQAESKDRISKLLADKIGDNVNPKYGFINFESDYIGDNELDNKPFTYNEDKTKVIDRENDTELTIEEVKEIMSGGITNIPLDLKVGDYINYKPTIPTTQEKEELRQNWIKYSGYESSSYFTISKFQPESNVKWQVLEIDREKGIVARNLKIEDLERNMDLSRWDYKNFTNASIKYGQRNNITTNLQYPSLIKQEKLPVSNKHRIDGVEVGGNIGISEQPKYYSLADYPGETAQTRLENVQTYWTRDKGQYSYKNPVLSDIIHKSPYYYLSSRYVYPETAYLYYGIRYVDNTRVAGFYRFYSNGTAGGVENRGFRPVVELGFKISFEKVTDGIWDIK